MYGIRLIESRGKVNHLSPEEPVQGDWLMEFDPESHDGIGMAGWTPDPAGAIAFNSRVEAYDLYMTVPECRKVRDDGKPNRPLTAYSVEICRIP